MREIRLRRDYKMSALDLKILNI
ncbi:hypothetical protein EMIT0232MI5_80095 [Pseudomonas sp. IT-232MI5]